MSDVPLPPPDPRGPLPPPGAGPTPTSTRRPLWKRWWVIALGVVVVLGVVGAIAGGGSDDDPGATDDSDVPNRSDPTDPTDGTDGTDGTDANPTTSPPEASTPPGTPSITEPAVETTEAVAPTAPAEDPAIGDVLETGSGGLARVNAVTPNAPARNEFLGPDPGFTLTEADVEICAGEDGQSVNPLYWKAFLADNTEAEVNFGSTLQTVGLAPGGCTRGFVAFAVPEGATVADVVLTDELLSEQARWSTATSVPVTSALTPSSPVAASPLGTLLTLADDATAVVRSVTPGAPPTNEFFPVAAGDQLVEIDVELCAGTASLAVNPLYWLVTAQDNTTGGASLGNGTLSSIDVAPGQCVAGTVQLAIPAASAPSYVLLTGALFDEEARWSAAP